jgi:multidrug resistance protein, MATE family
MTETSEPTIANPPEIDSGAETGPSGSRRFAHWWRSDWGPGPLLALAVPLMISTGLMSLTLFTDRALLYGISDEAVSAAMGAGSLYWALTCLPLGLIGYVSAFVSQYLGAERPGRIAVAYRHAVRLAWLVLPCMLLAIVFANVPFAVFGHAAELQRMETIYLRVLLIGGISALFYSAQSGLLTGLGRTRLVMAVDVVSTILNLVLDFVLIFGAGPIPRMGLTGAAVATAIAFWIKIPIMHWLMIRDPHIAFYTRPRQASNLPASNLAAEIRGREALPAAQAAAPARMAWEPGMIRRLILYGAPSGMQMLAESAAFAVIMLQVGRLGGLPMAASTLALGLNVLAFVPIQGLGIGVGVLVGRHLLEKRVDLAERTVTCALVLSVLYTAIFAVLLGFYPDLVSRVYAFGSEERFAEMSPLLIPLLRIVAFYCIWDGLQIVFVGAIKGAGDTWFVLLATALVAGGAVVVGLVCEALLGSSLMLWWYVIAGWVAGMTLAFGFRYLQGRWKNMQVIEREPRLD